MGDATPTASDHKLGISTGVSIAPSDISTHSDDFFVTTVGVYTLKLDATTDGGRSLYGDGVTNTGARTDEAVDHCRRPHTSIPPSPSCMGEREAKIDDDD
uniref:Uncharacterized protein n=1 Tax=Oryza sativa subsp. japonica TaxID=39947 RepID=Q6Z6T6_ORYSJ|nr:hypothetical protein [Oryza sativa Japonica Group]